MGRIVSLYEKSEHKRHLPASPMNLWWKGKKEDVTHVVVDMIHAFTDGSMACKNAENAIKNTVKFMNDNPSVRVLYVRDYHRKITVPLRNRAALASACRGGNARQRN